MRRSQNLVNSYYPFGLTFNSYKRVTAKENKYNTFQDQEKITDLDLNWIQFKWRNHDPAIGRFFNVDPLAEEYNYWTPYAFSGNMVTAHRELEGLEPQGSIFAEEFKQDIHAISCDLGRGWDNAVNGVTNFVENLKVQEGDGGNQPNGDVFYTKGGGASPTKQKSDNIGNYTDVGLLLEVIGNASGKADIPKGYLDTWKFYLDQFEKWNSLNRDEDKQEDEDSDESIGGTEDVDVEIYELPPLDSGFCIDCGRKALIGSQFHRKVEKHENDDKAENKEE